MISEIAADMAKRLRKNPKIDDRVFLVTGSPGSGKTHFVKENKTENDLVVDMDYICAALNASDELYGNHLPVLETACILRDALYDQIASRSGKWDKCFVISASKDADFTSGLAERLGAENNKMQASLDQCIENIDKDARRKDKSRFKELASDW